MKKAALKQAVAGVASARITETDHAARGVHLDISVSPENLLAAVTVLDQEGFFLEAVTGVDWLGEKAAADKAARAAAAAAAKKAAESGEPGPAEAPPAPAAAGASAEDDFEVVYDFNHHEELCRVTVRTRVARSIPEVPSICEIYPGADWHERETHDFFGIVFAGHPDLTPLLLPEDADFHPLRKDYRA